MKIFAKLTSSRLFKRGKRKKMRATVARRSLSAATADYEEMGEPNMKLSRALLIVLLLHVVAVSGIIAFNAIKTRQGSPSLPRLKTSSAATSAKTNAATTDGKPGEVRPAMPVTKQNGRDRHEDSHKTYVVAKGDNPVAIAKKFKVSYDELLALNHIDDPRKLKVGQKLLIPNKPPKKKADE